MLKKVENIGIRKSKISYLRRRIKNWKFVPPVKYPWRTERSKFHGLIAEILLQRTRAEQVIPVYKRFRREFIGPEELSRASVDSIRKAIASLGLSWRARMLKNLASRLNNLNGDFPDNYFELLDLPGVGPYAASAFLSFHRNKKATIIDSNIIRLYGRFLGFEIHPEIRRHKKMINLLEKITPAKESKRFNYSLLDLSRSICKPKPLCGSCPLAKKCFYCTTRGVN